MNIFVSSTYRDLSNHREILRIAIEMSGYRFKGMEHFAAQQTPPLDVCLNKLDECEVYIGIIGHLYGSCPPGRVRSYTELEYIRARELNKYIIVLFIGDGAQITISQIEQHPEKIDRLNRFRERIQERHTIDTFNDEHEAAWKILAALRNYEIKLREEQQDVGGIEE